MNNNSFLQEMPCHKYIFPKLSNTADALSYERILVDTLSVCGCSDSDIMVALTLQNARVFENPSLASYSFIDWKGTTMGNDLLSNIRLDSSIALYKRCSQFYAKFDSRTTACKICPLSKRCVNINGFHEKRLLRYMYESEENFSYFLEKGITGADFSFSYDLMEQGKAERPCLFALTKHLFHALEKESERGAYFSSEERSFLPSMKKYLIASVKQTKPPKAYMSSEWSMRSVEYFEEQLFSVPLCSKKEAEQSYSRLHKHSATKDRTSLNKASNLSPEELLPSSRGQAGKQKGNQPSGSRSVKRDSVKKNMGDKEPDVQTLDMLSLLEASLPKKDDVTANTQTSIEGEEDESSVTGGSTYPQWSSNEAVSLQLPVVYVPDDYNNEIAVDASGDNTVGISDKSGNSGFSTESKVPLENDSTGTSDTAAGPSFAFTDSSDGVSETTFYEIARCGSLLLEIPSISVEELRHFAIILDESDARLLTIFENSVLQGKVLCLELVRVGTIGVLLMWVPKLHSFVACGLKHKDIVSPLLSYNSVRKVCFHPYLLYSVFAEHGIVIKNLHAILTAFSITHGGVEGELYEDVFDCYHANRSVSGVTFKPEGEYSCSYIRYMPSYLFVMRKQLKSMDNRVIQFERAAAFDECLGMSYIPYRYIDKGSFLFDMTRPGEYLFSSEECLNTCHEGTFLTYCIMKSVSPAPRIVYDVLSELASAGRFRTYPMIITAFSKNQFTVYVLQEYVEYISTVFNVAFLSYIERTGETGLELFEHREVSKVVSRYNTTVPFALADDISILPMADSNNIEPAVENSAGGYDADVSDEPALPQDVFDEDISYSNEDCIDETVCEENEGVQYNDSEVADMSVFDEPTMSTTYVADMEETMYEPEPFGDYMGDESVMKTDDANDVTPATGAEDTGEPSLLESMNAFFGGL